ncbi:shikimate dehydrogenase [Microlunatus elymi]|uniref:Shikimate dehydrogenase n=1 Tax=Microlunatus elymi TaxID=2596828 RepID=A0A516PZW7_9ACTN|nr:shikimate dehydrogenase [Microlunatus elymi]QDP96735.1 shikimate dehydrogenase [Microlunatus elymi]
MTVRCAVLGSPIEHSLSPALHRAAYAALGLTDWEYQRHRVEADELAGFVAGLDPSWRGLSLTMPLKVAALELGEPDELALLAEAANTMIISADGGRRVYNTDVGGLVSAFAAAGVTKINSATVLGSGATARSSMISASRMGAERILLMARRVDHARSSLGGLADRLGVGLDVVGWGDRVPVADVLISTVVGGAADPIADAAAAAARVIFDVIYDPWPTALATAAEQSGRTVLNGLDLLVHQAIGQLELMTGRTVDPEVLLQAGRTALAAL